MYPKRSLGQYFLKCRWVISTLIKTAEVSQKDTVLEIGPGTGILTRELAKTAGKVIAIEKDEYLAANLTQRFKKDGVKNIEIIKGDILKKLSEITTNYKLQTNSYKVVANIPYYLTARLIRLLLECEPRPERIVLTVQKEVARRITAKPPHANLLTLSVQVYGTPQIIKDVPADCFYPKPKVDSTIISISDISDGFFQKNKISMENFFEILRLGFSQKRKMLLGVLGKKLDKQKIAAAFAATGINPKARPQELSLEQWAKLISSI